MVYAPWCGHCKRSMGTLDEVAATVPKNIEIAKIDYERYGKEIASRKIGATAGLENGVSMAIKKFPTILMVSNGEIAHYTGPREVPSMVNTVAHFAKRY